MRSNSPPFFFRSISFCLWSDVLTLEKKIRRRRWFKFWRYQLWAARVCVISIDSVWLNILVVFVLVYIGCSLGRVCPTTSAQCLASVWPCLQQPRHPAAASRNAAGHPLWLVLRLIFNSVDWALAVRCAVLASIYTDGTLSLLIVSLNSSVFIQHRHVRACTLLTRSFLCFSLLVASILCTSLGCNKRKNRAAYLPNASRLSSPLFGQWKQI